MKNKVRRNLKKNKFDYRKNWNKVVFGEKCYWYPMNIQIKNADKWEPLCAINIE